MPETLHTPATVTQAGTPQRIRLVTLNTWKCDGAYTQRLHAMALQLAELQPDLVALQESFSRVDGGCDTARVLAQALGLHALQVPARTKPRLCEGEWTWSHSGMAWLTRWPVSSHIALELPTVREDGERIALLCKVQAGPHRLALANVHLTHLPDEPRLRQRQLLTVLRHPWMHGKAAAAWVGGDFNASLQSGGWSPVLSPHGAWVDVASATGLTGKVTCRTPDGQGLDLDHVLSRSGSAWRCVRVQTALDRPDPQSGVCPSDHAAVCVDFEHLP